MPWFFETWLPALLMGLGALGLAERRSLTFFTIAGKVGSALLPKQAQTQGGRITASMI